MAGRVNYEGPHPSVIRPLTRIRENPDCTTVQNRHQQKQYIKQLYIHKTFFKKYLQISLNKTWQIVLK